HRSPACLPSPTLFRSLAAVARAEHAAVVGLDDGVDVLRIRGRDGDADDAERALGHAFVARELFPGVAAVGRLPQHVYAIVEANEDRKSTRLNSSHVAM